jgi:hypothetical protein
VVPVVGTEAATVFAISAVSVIKLVIESLVIAIATALLAPINTSL